VADRAYIEILCTDYLDSVLPFILLGPISSYRLELAPRLDYRYPHIVYCSRAHFLAHRQAMMDSTMVLRSGSGRSMSHTSNKPPGQRRLGGVAAAFGAPGIAGTLRSSELGLSENSRFELARAANVAMIYKCMVACLEHLFPVLLRS